MIRSLMQWSYRRSRILASILDLRVVLLIPAWIAVGALLGLAKVAAAPIPPANFVAGMVMLLPYLLVAAAPVLGYRMASAAFPHGLLSAQPSLRLSRLGEWRRVDVVEARRLEGFGPAGFMVSLIIGILLNVPVRMLEYVMIMPAIAPGAPGWAWQLMLVMTADVVIMGFFYMVCFVMALRSVPLFPRMLVFAWIIDVQLQLTIADVVSNAGHFPAQITAPLADLLEGNVHKVLISALVWLPYLILSDRVNLTFRHRVRTSD